MTLRALALALFYAGLVIGAVIAGDSGVGFVYQGF
jgi:hypothetical protein